MNKVKIVFKDGTVMVANDCEGAAITSDARLLKLRFKHGDCGTIHNIFFDANTVQAYGGAEIFDNHFEVIKPIEIDQETKVKLAFKKYVEERKKLNDIRKEQMGTRG